MMFTKLKIALAVAIAVAFVGTGTSLVSNHALNAGQPAPRKSEARQFLAKVIDDDKNAAKEDEEGGEEVPNRNVEADRQSSSNNLKQIGLAMQSYHDVHMHFPTSVIYGKDDKPLLSWRVAVLPYLDNEELHKEFKLDEPWDSAHNKKLLEKMPSLFSAPGIKTKKPYTTYYQLIVGKGAMFEGKLKISLRNITDGTAITVMAVEAEKPVPWTKPVDLSYDSEKPLPKLGGVFAHGLNLLFADGSVRFTKKGFDEKTMRAIITRAGGEKVDLSNLDP